MKKTVKILAALIALIVILFAGLTIFVSTLDADKYRPQLVDMLTKKTGRTVKLNGPIAFSLGLAGLHVSVQDASIGNPVWASRPNMAGMGKFELGVGLLPLLSHRLSINELSIENADILLETNAAGQHNWTLTPSEPATHSPSTPAAKTATSSEPNASLSINNLKIINSQLAMRAADGKISSYNIGSLNISTGGAGAELKLVGDVNAAPITLDVKTSLTDLLSKAPFTFDADATFDALYLTAKGNADIGGGKADISAYDLTAGKTKITGQLAATWNGPRPTLRGSLNSDRIDPADFKSGATAPETDKPGAATGSQPSTGTKRLFSDDLLPFDGLKAADADLAVTVGEFPVGTSALKQISAKLALSGGNLTLAPVKASIGATPVDVQVKLNAAQTPAHISVGIVANGVDLGDLQKLGGMTPFMTGKADANIQLEGEGRSPHEIASSLGGVITVTAEKGEILTGAAASVSSLLAGIFSAQGGNNTLNCLAARFIAKNGMLTDNGILIDSASSMVAGKGTVNLGGETVNLTLHAKTKLVDVGGLVPALQIGGPLSNPHYSVDAVGIVQNAIGSLLSGDANILASGVPDIQTAPAGQNACVYTLDHPKNAASSTVTPSTPMGKVNQKIQNLGNSLKGLLGQ